MKLRELYPYWSGVHDDFLALLEVLPEPLWRTRFNITGGASSVRAIALQLIDDERFWIGHIAQGQTHEAVTAADYPSGLDIIDQYRAVRAATERYLTGLTPEALRAVRVAPADPVKNEIERNVPLSWVIWHVLEQEMFALGQVRVLIELQRNA